MVAATGEIDGAGAVEAEEAAALVEVGSSERAPGPAALVGTGSP